MRYPTRNTHLVLALSLSFLAGPALGAVPDVTKSYYTPEAGPVTAPLTGNDAVRWLKMCPNNDGSQSLGNSVRIKIVIKMSDGSGLVGIPSTDIVALFNGGTAAQGFSGIGADSIIANSWWNPDCPDLRFIPADAPTDRDGVTYMTFTGNTLGNPGVGVRDATRKWGHYDSQIPVYVLGFTLQGRLTDTSPAGSFTLQIKNLDTIGGLQPVAKQGELVNNLDINPVQAEVAHGTFSFWHDFDWNGAVNSADLNFVKAHNNHRCTKPLNP